MGRETKRGIDMKIRNEDIAGGMISVYIGIFVLSCLIAFVTILGIIPLTIDNFAVFTNFESILGIASNIVLIIILISLLTYIEEIARKGQKKNVKNIRSVRKITISARQYELILIVGFIIVFIMLIVQLI
jgi:hypothetical protein